MMRRAITQHLENNPELEKLLPHIRGNVGMVLTDEDLVEIRDMILANKVAAPARANAIAPHDVIVPAQNTGLGPETSVLCWNDDVIGCDCVCTSWGSHLVGKDHVTDLNEIFVGENHTNITSDVWKKFFQLRVVFKMLSDGTPHHGVLTHQNFSLSSH